MEQIFPLPPLIYSLFPLNITSWPLDTCTQMHSHPKTHWPTFAKYFAKYLANIWVEHHFRALLPLRRRRDTVEPSVELRNGRQRPARTHFSSSCPTSFLFSPQLLLLLLPNCTGKCACYLFLLDPSSSFNPSSLASPASHASPFSPSGIP